MNSVLDCELKVLNKYIEIRCLQRYYMVPLKKTIKNTYKAFKKHLQVTRQEKNINILG